MPIVQTPLNNEKGIWAVVYTGSAGGLFIEHVFTTIVVDHNSLKPITKSTSLIGPHIRSKNVKLIVGYEVLKHFVLTVDYKQGRMRVGLPENLSANASAAR